MTAAQEFSQIGYIEWSDDPCVSPAKSCLPNSDEKDERSVATDARPEDEKLTTKERK